MQFSKLQTLSTSQEDGRIFLSPNESIHPLGRLVVLFDVPRIKLSGLAQLDDLVAYLDEQYYASNAPDPEAALEELLSSLNDSLNSYLPGIEPAVAHQHAAFFVGVIKDNSLYFSKTGRIRLLLQHNDSIIDILGQDDGETDTSSFFSFVTSGKLSPNDSLLITTGSLLDYFSDQKLKQILGEHSAEQSIKEFAVLVDEFTHHTFFQAIVIQNTAIKPLSHISKSSHSIDSVTSTPAQSSISALNALEDKTSELLTNNTLSAFVHSFKNLVHQVKGIFSNDYATSESGNTEQAIKRRLRQKNILTRITNNIWLGIKTVGLVLLWIGQQIAGGIVALFKRRKIITDSVKHRSAGLPQKIKHKTVSAVTHFNKLDARRKRILGIGAGLVIVLLISIAFGITRQTTTVSRDEALTIFDEIEVKKAAADAALIYGNDAQAALQVAEARKLLNDLEVRSTDLKDRKAQLATDLFETYKSIQKLEEVNNPALLVDLSADAQGSPIELRGLVGSGATFYGYTSNNTIYEFSISDGSANALVESETPITKLVLLNDSELLIYAGGENAQIGVYNLRTNVFTPIDVGFNNTLSQKADFETYFGRLYVLDPRERQIFRHSVAGSGYGRGQAWVTDSTVDLSDATDMAIDGTIWAVTGSGSVYHLNGGEKEEYSVGGLDPILNSPNFIWTSIDTERLYLLDPPTRRIVILEKDGGVYKQFVSERFDNLKSAVVDEENNKMYVLNHSQIYELDIE